MKYTDTPVYFWAIIIKKSNKHLDNIKIDQLFLEIRKRNMGYLWVTILAGERAMLKKRLKQ